MKLFITKDQNERILEFLYYDLYIWIECDSDMGTSHNSELPNPFGYEEAL